MRQAIGLDSCLRGNDVVSSEPEISLVVSLSFMNSIIHSACSNIAANTPYIVVVGSRDFSINIQGDNEHNPEWKWN